MKNRFFFNKKISTRFYRWRKVPVSEFLLSSYVRWQSLIVLNQTKSKNFHFENSSRGSVTGPSPWRWRSPIVQFFLPLHHTTCAIVPKSFVAGATNRNKCYDKSLSMLGRETLSQRFPRFSTLLKWASGAKRLFRQYFGELFSKIQFIYFISRGT